ncbi:GntR family transcriptional regulator [Cupriavidus basilensis]
MSETFEWQGRVRLVEEVAQVLRRRIYRGVYPPGKPLRQVEISRTRKISRTPLREALRILEREGLVSAETARGVTVVSADFRQLMDACELREVIDGLAARLAASRASELAGAPLRAIIETQQGSLGALAARGLHGGQCRVPYGHHRPGGERIPGKAGTHRAYDIAGVRATDPVCTGPRAGRHRGARSRSSRRSSAGMPARRSIWPRLHIRNSMARLKALAADGNG